MKQKKIKKKRWPLQAVYRLLETGPVVLLSTQHKGEEDVMAMSWHTMLEFTPPLVGCVVSNRNHSFELLKKSGQCVINIPSAEQSKLVVAVGNCSGRNVDKFARFKLKKSEGVLVNAPLLDDCFANLECRVVDRCIVDKYNFFVLEVVRAWIDPRFHKLQEQKTIHHRGQGYFMLAGKTIKLRSSKK